MDLELVCVERLDWSGGLLASLRQQAGVGAGCRTARLGITLQSSKSVLLFLQLGEVSPLLLSESDCLRSDKLWRVHLYTSHPAPLEPRVGSITIQYLCVLSRSRVIHSEENLSKSNFETPTVNPNQTMSWPYKSVVRMKWRLLLSISRST
jgi:hypothetical protein